MVKQISEELLRLFESLLRAQLNTIRQLRKAAGYVEPEEPKEKRMSHMDMVYDILSSEQRPLHVDAIITAMESKFKTKVDKESLVSALLKRVRRQDRFVKLGRNTFGLLSSGEEGGTP